MKDYYLFIKRFFSNPSSIGSLFPSSPKLAKGMTKKVIPQSASALRYLEVGAGSGALTKRLIKKMGKNDRLDIVEMDPSFCTRLRRKYGHLPHVTIYQRSILDHMENGYDVIVSSLPLNSFSSSLVDQVLLKYKYLLKPRGSISFFEYIALAKIKELSLSGSSKVDFQMLLSLKRSFVSSYCTETNKIWWNVPPARIYYCQL